MIVTEDEARERACPNRFDNSSKIQNGRCIASRCMAWRWRYEHNKAKYPNEEYYRKTNRGGCGLLWGGVCDESEN